ncbi:MAG: DUF4382 domain-containing protein [Bacillota bacterium]
MAVSKRKIGIYSITGIAAAIIIIALIFASGIQIPLGSDSPRSKTGTLVVSIKDAPVDLKELWITIDSLYIQNAQDDKWTELTLDSNQPTEFDLLTLRDTSLLLSQNSVLAGDYSKIRLGVESAIATYTDSKGASHTGEELKVPPGHIDIITSFQVGEGQVTGLLIDMQPDTAAISQSGNFKPTIKMTVTLETLPSPSPSPSPTESPSSTSSP